MSAASTVDTCTLDITYRKPKTRQRIHKEPAQLPVPDINDDAAERKRILNVYAQRRYRERKRQEKRRGRATPGDDSTLPPRSSAPDTGSDDPGVGQDVSSTLSEIPIVTDELSASTYLGDALPTPASIFTPSLDFNTDSIPREVQWPTALSLEQAGVTNLLPETANLDLVFSALQTGAGAGTADGFLDLLLLSSPSLSSDTSPLASGYHQSEMTTSSPTLSFPDSYYLPVNELKLLQGMLRIAARLSCNTKTIWELDATSPFHDGTHTAQTARELPDAWRPTAAQTSVAHHPVIDVLPWPNVRDRLLMIMDLPDDVRPIAASGPLAVAQLAYDLENAAEGIRIWGDDPCEPTAWEIGQVVFERWWFIFDRQVIEQSNYWRTLRGAALLVPKHHGTTV